MLAQDVLLHKGRFSNPSQDKPSKERVGKMSMHIGIMGGTFNPIHCAHLHIAKLAAKHGRMDRVLLIPNFIPPHKCQPGVSAEDRFAMAKLCADDDPLFDASPIELAENAPSYTVNTVTKLKAQYGASADLSFITGADSLLKSKWYRLDDIIGMLKNFYAVARPGFTKEILDARIAEMNLREPEKIIWIEDEGLNISSTDIRQRVKGGAPLDGLLPAAVIEYIKQNNLYK